MIKQPLLAMCIICTLQLSAQGLPPMPANVARALITTDGKEVYPKGAIASGQQVKAVESKADAVSAKVSAQEAELTTMQTTIDSLTAEINDATRDGIWWLQAYANSISVLTGIPPYTGELQIVDLKFTEAEAVITLWCSQVPAAASQLEMMGSTTLSGFKTEKWVCSYPTTVPNPADKTSGVCYTYTSARPQGQHFWKVVASPDGAVSDGYGFPIYGGLSVNGAKGKTVTITADDGTVLNFVGGVLVDDLTPLADEVTP